MKKKIWERVIPLKKSNDDNVAVNIISLEDLIKLKKALKRPQDLIDIEKLNLVK
ncbi:MAG: hypothetical protein AB1349_05440 [Elusimicrobiota bacterium]